MFYTSTAPKSGNSKRCYTLSRNMHGIGGWKRSPPLGRRSSQEERRRKPSSRELGRKGNTGTTSSYLTEGAGGRQYVWALRISTHLAKPGGFASHVTKKDAWLWYVELQEWGAECILAEHSQPPLWAPRRVLQPIRTGLDEAEVQVERVLHPQGHHSKGTITCETEKDQDQTPLNFGDVNFIAVPIFRLGWTQAPI